MPQVLLSPNAFDRVERFTFSGRCNYVARRRSNYDYVRTTQFEEGRNIL
jgi:hypothetical protein